jgi:voltage-gated potassium channel
MLIFKNKLFFLVLVLIAIFAIGTLGLFLIEGPAQGMTLFDAFYLTAITLFTIGFGEIPNPLSIPGRLFVVVLAFVGMGTLLYAVSSVTAFLVEGQLRDLIRRRKMENRIGKLKEHHIVCGSGLIARYIIDELRRTRYPFVLVDRDKNRLHDLAAADHDINFIVGDVSEDAVLQACGIDRARGLLSALDSDQDNLFTVITARRLNPKLRIVSVAVAEASIPKLRYAGANGVVSPNFIGSLRMVSELVRPAAVGFLDVMLKDKRKNWRIEEATLTADCHLCGKELGKAMVKEHTGVLVLGILKPGAEDYIYNPPRETVLEPGDTLVILGSVDQIVEFKKAVVN